MPEENQEQKIPAPELYQLIYKEMKLNPRTVQWYATEGYIPKPEKVGAEAFYSASAQIPTRIRVIQLLQKRYDRKLKEIKEIVVKHAESDWETLLNLFTALQEHFPEIEHDYHGNEMYSQKGDFISKIVINKLKVCSIDEISLADAEEEYDKALADDPAALYEEFQ